MTNVVLTENAARAIARDHARLRGLLGNASPPQRTENNRARVQRRTTALGLCLDDIAAPTASPLTFNSGQVKLYLLEPDGTLSETPEFVVAFNALSRPLLQTQPVELDLDWTTGRWLIVGAEQIATDIYFKATGAFGTGSATFPAQLIAHFDGCDPRPLHWSQSGVDNVINPATGGSHFFAGVSGVYGFAKWHDVEPFTSALPAGYWCYQLQCAVA